MNYKLLFSQHAHAERSLRAALQLWCTVGRTLHILSGKEKRLHYLYLLDSLVEKADGKLLQSECLSKVQDLLWDKSLSACLGCFEGGLRHGG